ncbi:MAG: CHASE domain-containing protein, partial [Nevskia sp.]|nr:CHASE domain-containing protein [Nevskia sp.]
MMPRDAATPPPGEEDGGSVRGWPRRLLAAGLLLVLGLVATELFVAAYAENQRQRLREQTVLHVAAMRAQMESALDSTAFLAQGLVAYIKSVHTIDRGHVDAALRALVQADRRIRNIGLAPDNVLSYIYPLRGNEAALGLDYRKVPSQWPSVERAIRQRSALLAGPVNLVQGGRGVICRTPVFLDDGRYWGMISVVIDLDLLLSDIQLRDTVDGLRYFLRGDNAGAAQASDLIVGSPEVLR